jgi:hypothetical protein
MRFQNFKEFREVLNLQTLDRVITYLTTDLARTLRDLSSGLQKLSFADNFEAFQVTVTIPPSVEQPIRNQFRGGNIPVSRLVLRADTGGRDIVDGTTAWNENFVYLKNIGATTGTVTVVFFKG